MGQGGGGLRWGGGRARVEGTGLISSLRVRRGEVDGGLGRGGGSQNLLRDDRVA